MRITAENGQGIWEAQRRACKVRWCVLKGRKEGMGTVGGCRVGGRVWRRAQMGERGPS